MRMEKMDDVEPLSSESLNRRKYSLDGHISRIRTANSKRQIIPFQRLMNAEVSPSATNAKLRSSLKPDTVYGCKYHNLCIPEVILKNVNSDGVLQKDSSSKSQDAKFSLNSIKSSNVKRPVPKKHIFKQQTSSLEKSTSDKDQNYNQNVIPESSIPPRSSGKRNTASKIKGKSTAHPIPSAKRKSNKKTQSRSSILSKGKGTKTSLPNQETLNRKEKSLGTVEVMNHTGLGEDRPLEEDKETQNRRPILSKGKGTKASPQNLVNLNRKDKNLDTVEIMKHINLDGEKDIIIMNWLHKLNCPNSKQFTTRKSSYMTTKLNNRSHAGVPKYPSIASTNKKGNRKVRIKEIAKLPTQINSRKISYTNKAKPIRRNSNSPGRKRTAGTKDFDAKSVSSGEKTNNSSESRKAIPTHKIANSVKGKMNRLQAETSRSIEGVEMYFSELGKLHIVLDAKSISKEDAAIIVWLGDINFDKLNTKKRSSMSILKATQSSPMFENQENILKSKSVLELEDTVSPRPIIYFPPVTLIKNIAVDSKVGLRVLNEDSSSSVFYTRCNLKHVGSEQLT